VPSVVQQQIAENTAAHTRALRAQESIVTELRKQVLNMNQDFIERQRNFTLKESELQAQIAQAQELNRGLMEENESYQMLLHEKSMNGEFMQTSIMKVNLQQESNVMDLTLS
jgi:ABC-type phosphate transport system auxiliary subunit